MEEKNHIYIAIDLKSFYASVECVERRLDPLLTPYRKFSFCPAQTLSFSLGE